MDAGKKPLTRFLEEYYKGDFSDFIKEEFGNSEQMSEDAVIYLNEVYLEGFLDGVRLIIWAMDN